LKKDFDFDSPKQRIDKDIDDLRKKQEKEQSDLQQKTNSTNDPNVRLQLIQQKQSLDQSHQQQKQDLQVKHQRIIDNKEGCGVLFVDEAYQLLSNDTGKQSLDKLLKEMTDRKGRLVVIFAGS